MGEDPEPVKHPPTYEIIKTLTPTALVVAGFLSHSHAILYSFAALSVVAIFYDRIKYWLLSGADRLHDRGVAKKNIKQLQVFSEEIGVLLDISRTGPDTLHGILSTIGQRDIGLQGSICLPDVAIFNSRWYFLNERIHNEKFKTGGQFHYVVKDFGSLVSSYGSYAVHPAFYACAQQSLRPSERSQMNAFQIRWSGLVSEYIRYVKELNKEFRQYGPLPIGINAPGPLA